MSLTKVSNSMITGAVANVQDYGASPSASAATNVAAINAAIAANPVVYFPSGTYATNAAIVINAKNCTLLGAGLDSVYLASTNAADDVIRVIAGANGVLNIRDITTSGGLNGIFIDGSTGTYLGANSTLENIHVIGPVNAGLKILGNDVTGSTFIYGRVKNYHFEGNVGSLYGIYAKGYNVLNTAHFQDLRIVSGVTGIHLEETLSTNVSTLFDNVTIEDTENEAIDINGYDALFINPYFEGCGVATNTAEINMNATVSIFCRLTLINPYFGAHGTASVTTNVVSFRTNYCSLDIIGAADRATKTIDGNNKTAGGYINLYGWAGKYVVTDFSYGEVIVGLYEASSWTVSIFGLTTTPTQTMQMSMSGTNVTMTLPAAFTGTSNNTSKVLTGMPAQYRPTAVRTFPLVVSDNGGARVYGEGSIGTNGNITIYPTPVDGNWTASGTCVIDTFSITYIK